MKKLLALFLASILLAGCTTRTEFGPCVGVDNMEQDQHLIYKLSVKNVALAVIFSETIVVPVVVLVSEFQCPIGRK